jgi:hypothetical protein
MGSYAAAGHIYRSNPRRADGQNKPMAICLLLAVFGGLMVAVHGEGIRDRFLRALVLGPVGVRPYFSRSSAG